MWTPGRTTLRGRSGGCWCGRALCRRCGSGPGGARPHDDPEEIRRLLVRQVLSPVLWEQTVRNLMADGFDKFYEIGPGRVLAGLIKRVQRKADVTNVAA